MERSYLVFDAGTQSVKVAVYGSDHVCLAESSHPTTLRYPDPRMVEMDVDEYLSLTKLGIRECVSQMVSKGLDPRSISAVMGDGIICGIVGVDEKGDAVTQYINYLDSRTQEDADAINSERRGIWGQETGNADASCMFPAMFARWFLRNSDAFRERGVRFVHNAPYILMHLAGLDADDAFIDQGAMSGWGLGYDVMEKRWSDAQLDILGIDAGCMPRILKPWDVVGRTTEALCLETGLPAGIPVCAGAGDTMQSMLGSGVFGPGRAVDVAGTCAMFCVSTDGINPELSSHGTGLIFNSGTLDDSYFYWGYIRTGGLSLRWFRDSVCSGSVSFGELSAEAASVPAGSDGVMFLPYLTGGIGDMSDASGCFLNMGMDTSRPQLWRSVLEAIGYDYMSVTDQYRHAGIPVDRLGITEGGSVDSLWNQMKSDMIGCEAFTMETNGGALLIDSIVAAYAIGEVGGLRDAVAGAISVKESYVPDPDNIRRYRSLYDIRCELVEKDMKGVFSSLRRAQGVR